MTTQFTGHHPRSSSSSRPALLMSRSLTPRPLTVHAPGQPDCTLGFRLFEADLVGYVPDHGTTVTSLKVKVKAGAPYRSYSSVCFCLLELSLSGAEFGNRMNEISLILCPPVQPPPDFVLAALVRACCG